MNIRFQFSTVFFCLYTIFKIIQWTFFIYWFISNWKFLVIVGILLWINYYSYCISIYSDPGYVRKRKYGEYTLERIELNDNKIIQINTVTDKREVIDPCISNIEIFHENFYLLSNDGTVTTIYDKNICTTQGTYVVFTQKYCNTCNLFRAPGMAHCYDCNYCVLDKDHHCDSLGNCLGRNNLRIYMVFILSDLIQNTIFAYKIDRLLDKILFLNKNFLTIVIGILGILSNFPIPINLLVVGKFYYCSLIDLRARDWILKKRKGQISIMNIFKRLLTFRSPIYSI